MTAAKVEHEASTSKMNEEQLFYLEARGISREDAISMIVHGFCKEVIRRTSPGIRRRGSKALNAEAGELCWIDLKIISD